MKPPCPKFTSSKCNAWKPSKLEFVFLLPGGRGFTFFSKDIFSRATTRALSWPLGLALGQSGPHTARLRTILRGLDDHVQLFDIVTKAAVLADGADTWFRNFAPPGRVRVKHFPLCGFMFERWFRRQLSRGPPGDSMALLGSLFLGYRKEPGERGEPLIASRSRS